MIKLLSLRLSFSVDVLYLVDPEAGVNLEYAQEPSTCIVGRTGLYGSRFANEIAFQTFLLQRGRENVIQSKLI